MTFTTTTIPYSQLPLSKRDLAFLQEAPSLLPFIPFRDSLDGLRKKITHRRQFPFFRKELAQSLTNQYRNLKKNKRVADNIAAVLDNNTFTVTTAHQPSLFTGPLYVIYKAASCINLANQLQKEHPDLHIVPLFILGAEDHDFDEINHLHIYNQTITWNQNCSGPTGSLSTDSLQGLITNIKELLPQTPDATKIIQDLAESFAPGNTFANATQDFIHRIFGQYGLVVLQMSDPTLKQLAIPIFQKEITERPSFNIINQTISQLKEIGFKPQAKPRELNLFYMTDQSRKRIVFEKNQYHILGTDTYWTQKEILQELDRSPQSFSPNVIMRPLYQELILPNIAYIGGGGELAYWQERYTQFQEFGISYPVIIRRNSALWINSYATKQLTKLRLKAKDITLSIKDLSHVSDTQKVDLSTQKERQDLDHIFQLLAQKADLVDPSLRPRILAEKAKQEKAIKNIETKLNKAYREKNQAKINKITKLKAKLFPESKLQERLDNFLPIFADHGQGFIDYLVQEFDPLDKQFRIISTK